MEKVLSGIVTVEVESGQDCCRECDDCALSIVRRFLFVGCFRIGDCTLDDWTTRLLYLISNWESWRTAEFQNLLGHVVILMSCCAHAVLTCSQTHLDSWLLRTNCKNMKRTRLWRRIVKSKLLKIPNLSRGNFWTINLDTVKHPLGALESPHSRRESDCILGDRIKISGTYREFIVFGNPGCCDTVGRTKLRYSVVSNLVSEGAFWHLFQEGWHKPQWNHYLGGGGGGFPHVLLYCNSISCLAMGRRLWRIIWTGKQLQYCTSPNHPNITHEICDHVVLPDTDGHGRFDTENVYPELCPERCSCGCSHRFP